MSHSMTATWLLPVIRWLGCATSSHLIGIYNVKCFEARGEGRLSDEIDTTATKWKIDFLCAVIKTNT